MRCLLLLLLLASTATASPRVEVTGGACDLGALAVDGPTSAVVRVDTAVQGEQIAATIRFEDGRRRRVSVASCAELADAVALIIEMGLAAPRDAAVRAPVELAVALALAVAPAVPEPTDFGVVVAETTSRSSHGWREELSAGTRWRRAARSLGVELRVGLPAYEDVAAAARIDVWTAAVRVSPCMHRGAFAGCVTATAGTIAGSGDGLVDGARAVTPYLASGLRLTWEHGLTGPYALQLQLDADVAATTTRFDVDHMTVWSTDRVTLWGGAGVISHFP